MLECTPKPYSDNLRRSDPLRHGHPEPHLELMFGDFDSGMTLPITPAIAPLVPLLNPNREPNRNPSHKAKALKPAIF